jgi:stage IV sporulation protein B
VIKRQRRKILLIGFLLIFTFSIQQTFNKNEESLPFFKSYYSTDQTQLTSYNPVLNFFGFLPKSNEVEKPKIEVLPGGHSIGVTLQTKGVLVVGYAPIINTEGKEAYPAKDSGVEVGDIILKINGTKALNDYQVAQEIDKSCRENKTINLEIKHKGQINQKTIQPVYCSETQRYRVGLYIRDEAAGVGTLTFLDPKTNTFGALGHVITDIDTNDQIELSEGKVVESTIYAIEKGKKGDPGEKIGTFMINSSFSGKIVKNSSSGVFGNCEGTINNPYFSSPVPIAWKSEIKTGPAKMYTVIKDNTIQEFDISIEKIMHYRSDNKNMIVKVTDPELLEKTGGIVQGMSGSPIIQNGKLVGAITHVFVNDATRGYGVFIEKMLNESGLISKAATAQRGGFLYAVSPMIYNMRQII